MGRPYDHSSGFHKGVGPQDEELGPKSQAGPTHWQAARATTGCSDGRDEAHATTLTSCPPQGLRKEGQPLPTRGAPLPHATPGRPREQWQARCRPPHRTAGGSTRTPSPPRARPARRWTSSQKLGPSPGGSGYLPHRTSRSARWKVVANTTVATRSGCASSPGSGGTPTEGRKGGGLHLAVGSALGDVGGRVVFNKLPPNPRRRPRQPRPGRSGEPHLDERADIERPGLPAATQEPDDILLVVGRQGLALPRVRVGDLLLRGTAPAALMTDGNGVVPRAAACGCRPKSSRLAALDAVIQNLRNLPSNNFASSIRARMCPTSAAPTGGPRSHDILSGRAFLPKRSSDKRRSL